MSIEHLEREIDALLAEQGIATDEKVGTVPVEEGIALLQVLDVELRPFLIRYTALLNKTGQYVPIEPSKLERFMPLAERLSDCVETMLASYGTSYLTAIDMMVNGINCKNANVTDIEDLIQFLFYDIQLTDDANGTIRLFTYSKGKGSGLYGVTVIKDEDSED